MKESKYVIIGGCAAGIGGVEAIREIDQNGEITVISEEQCSCYSRPMISDFVSGKADFQKMKTRNDQFWKENTVKVLSKKAVRLNTDDHLVTMEDGEKILYRKLLLATGGKPFIPKIDGLEKEGVFSFTNVNDAEKLVQMISNGSAKTAVVIGAGLIGISVTEALIKRGIKVILVELQEKILSLLLDPKAASIVEATVEESGVNIITGQSVQKIIGKPDNDKKVGGVILTKGNEIKCDIVIVAIGVIPRTELAEGTNIRINRGIIVDNYMQTNVKDVYASGDVAEAYDFILDQNRLLPLWPLAVLEGKIAGYNMAGKCTDYTGGTNMSSLKYFGIPIISIGLANPKDNSSFEILTKQDDQEGIYKKIVLRNNTIIGMTFLGDIERAGILFYLMKNKINVEKLKNEILADDFSLAKLPLNIRKKMRIEDN